MLPLAKATPGVFEKLAERRKNSMRQLEPAASDLRLNAYRSPPGGQNVFLFAFSSPPTTTDESQCHRGTLRNIPS